MKLKDKYALIIGGSVGIGGAISEKLGKEGCNLIITYNKGEKEAKQLVEKFKSDKIKCLIYHLDILNKKNIKYFFKNLVTIVPRIDIAINNAGVETENRFIDLTEEEWDFVMNVNIKGLFFCCQEEAKIMIKQNSGKIINTGSLAAKIGVPFIAHYSASKFAVLGLTFSMARELAPYNIKVNAVCPGIVLTKMMDQAWSSKSKFMGLEKTELIERDKLRIPLNKFATPEDISNMFYLLSLDEADYITGQAINVNGGMESH
jgi:meso-butanediol dehydrogenase / (S,S)-butanediol dehydrogenase / diacetyl reductase